MTKELEGKTALVTGGTSGIGRDTAVVFAKAGAKVVVAGRREIEGNGSADLVRAAGGEALFVKTDVSKASEVENLVKKTVEKFGRLDVAFNNAGIEGKWVPIISQTEDDWDRTIDINLKGVWLCLKYEIRQMLKQGGGGAIVNMSSVTGLMGGAGAATYNASKHGVIGLTKVCRARKCTESHSRKRRMPRGDRNGDGRAAFSARRTSRNTRPGFTLSAILENRWRLPKLFCGCVRSALHL